MRSFSGGRIGSVSWCESFRLLLPKRFAVMVCFLLSRANTTVKTPQLQLLSQKQNSLNRSGWESLSSHNRGLGTLLPRVDDVWKCSTGRRVVLKGTGRVEKKDGCGTASCPKHTVHKLLSHLP